METLGLKEIDVNREKPSGPTRTYQWRDIDMARIDYPPRKWTES